MLMYRHCMASVSQPCIHPLATVHGHYFVGAHAREKMKIDLKWIPGADGPKNRGFRNFKPECRAQ
jgi:hypothetical protein